MGFRVFTHCMISTLPDVLARIVATKRDELAKLLPLLPELEKSASQPRRGFAARLRATPPAIISEIKKASPSKGILSHDFDPPRIARAYQSGGASALSVLTDQQYFQGSLADLQSARAAVALPVLRKDFTIHEAHVIEAAAHGADAILLIVACLSVPELRRLRELAESYSLDVLVEVHTADELQMAIDSGASLIGVNNRNLHTFEVRLELSLDLAPHIPASALRVAESGIFTHTDVARLQDAGFHAFLVGEHLMRSPDPAAALRTLRGQ